MSAQGAPNRHTLWCWLEKDLSNQGKAQSYMLHKCEVENSNKKIQKKRKEKSADRNLHRKHKKKKHTNRNIHLNAVQRMQSITNYLNPTDLDQNNGNQEINQQAELYGDKYNIKPDGVTRI